MPFVPDVVMGDLIDEKMTPNPPALAVLAVVLPPEFVKLELINSSNPALVCVKRPMPVVPKFPVQFEILISALALLEEKVMPVLLVQFRLQFWRLTMDAADPVTAKRAAEFV